MSRNALEADAPQENSRNEALGLVCAYCPRHCRIPERKRGACRVRENRDGQNVCANYGLVTSLALDPIEKKPLKRFHPGSYVLSVGSFGCNLACPFCQNASISQVSEQQTDYEKLTPERLAQLAVRCKPEGNIGLAYTYNEPMVGFEFVRDTGRLIHENGLLNVIVTNGCVSRVCLEEVLPVADAMNIDLKAFTPEYYRWLGGDLETVKEFIRQAAGSCHVELTTLIVPGKNDSPKEMDALSSWVASVDPQIPLHITRYFPRYHLSVPATPVETVLSLCDTARAHLSYVYPGNL